jgi:CrcB protein
MPSPKESIDSCRTSLNVAIFATPKHQGRRRSDTVTGAVWVALGSGLGGMARYAISGAVAVRVGETFPWGTMVVNVFGCFVIGALAALIAPGGSLPGDPTLRELGVIGLCGGYTTFSSVSLQTLTLAREGEWARALANIGASIALCLVAVWVGFAVAARFSGG